MWKGPDTYEALQKHEIGKPVKALTDAGYVFFHGGDLSYLSTAYGLRYDFFRRNFITLAALRLPMVFEKVHEKCRGRQKFDCFYHLQEQK